MALPEQVPEPSWWNTLNESVQNHLKSLVVGKDQSNEELKQTVIVEAGIAEPEAEEFLNWYFATQVEQKANAVKTEGEEEEKKSKKKKIYNDEVKYDTLVNLASETKVRLDPDHRKSVKIKKENNQFVILEGKHGDGIDVGMGVLTKFEKEGVIKYCIVTPGFCVTYLDAKKVLKITEVIRIRIPKLSTYNTRPNAPKAARNGRQDFRFENFLATNDDIVLYPYFSHFGSKCQACFNFAVIKITEEAYSFIEENCLLKPIADDTEKILNRAKIFKEEKQSALEVCGYPGVDEHSKSYELFSHTIPHCNDLETGMDSDEHGAIYYSNSCTSGQAGSGIMFTYENVSYLAGIHIEVDFNEKEDYGIGCIFTKNVRNWLENQVFDGVVLPSHFTVGAFVELYGLKSAKGQALNKLRGTIVSKGKNARWGIKLVDGREVAIKQDNLLTLKSLEDKKEENETKEKEEVEPEPIDVENLTPNQKRWMDDMMGRQARGMN